MMIGKEPVLVSTVLFTERKEWIFPCIAKRTSISGALTFWTDANKLRMVGYNAGNIMKITKSPYNSVPKSELFDILMVLLDFNEYLNIIADSQYVEKLSLYIETAELALIILNWLWYSCK